MNCGYRRQGKGRMRKPVKVRYPFADVPSPELFPPFPCEIATPGEAECLALWDKYLMRPNIRLHSRLVADIAAALAEIGEKKSLPVDAAAVRAAGMLHDIAKTWCIEHKGAHAIIGASWALMETRRYDIAQGVLLHVHWPWQLPKGHRICCLPILTLYADKRARHDQCVTLAERFEDLQIRYGKTEEARAGIQISFEQAKIIEAELSTLLGLDLNEYTLDSGRLVERKGSFPSGG